MRKSTVPLLLFAQSARFLAESAAQAGYPVWVADCYGDIDTQKVATRLVKLPALEKLTAEQLLVSLLRLTNGENCLLICGSGIERCYPLLKLLPAHIQLAGNNGQTIEQITTPALFFALLDKLHLAYPPTRFNPVSDTANWLFKPTQHWGGVNIKVATKKTPVTDGYLQQQIAGRSYGLLFLADGNKAMIILCHRQQHTGQEPTPFKLLSLNTPVSLSRQLHATLLAAANKITAATGLCGFNSLDFILDPQGNIFILEVNPRPTASLELVADKLAVISLQLVASQQSSTSFSFPITATARSRRLSYLYAPYDLKIPNSMVWPVECHDLPESAAFINQGQPVCTLLLAGTKVEIAARESLLIGDIMHKLPLQA